MLLERNIDHYIINDVTQREIQVNMEQIFELQVIDKH